MAPALKLSGRFDASDADVKKELSALEIDQKEHLGERRSEGLDTQGIAASALRWPVFKNAVTTELLEEWRSAIFRLTDSDNC